MKPTLSVIISCYNCAPVITRCLDSIDYPNSEILVVNDGSIDNIVEVVEQYAIAHPNVRLINKKNGGVSSARNLGIENAKGKYIVFVDADDYLSQDGLERMIDFAEKYQADIVKYKIQFLDHDAHCVYNSVKEENMNVEVISGRAQALHRYDISDYHVVDAVFRTATIKDNHLQFNTHLNLREDDAFMGAFYCVASQVVVTDLHIYNYISSSYYSSTHRQSIERQRLLIDSGLRAIQYRKRIIKERCPNQEFPYERLKYMRWVCTLRQAVEAQMSYCEYKAILDEFRKERVYPLDYDWIEVAGVKKGTMHYYKRLLQSFLTNHLWLGWPFALLKYRKSE